MANEKVYVVTHTHSSLFDDNTLSNFSVLGVCKNVDEAKRIA